MKNHGKVLKDTGLIIALSIQKGEVAPAKALYRAAQALVALDRWEEARDVVERAKSIPGEDGKAEWKKLGDEIERTQKREADWKERDRRERLGKLAVQQAIKVSSSA